jgi:DNA-entry nuclease
MKTPIIKASRKNHAKIRKSSLSFFLSVILACTLCACSSKQSESKQSEQMQTHQTASNNTVSKQVKENSIQEDNTQEKKEEKQESKQSAEISDQAEVAAEKKELSVAERSALAKSEIEDAFSYDSLASYSNAAYIVVNDNIPYFEEEELSDSSFEQYDDLDNLGRCTFALASIGQDLMPTQERGSISEVHPSGWINHTYDFVDGSYVYNRCHLIGYQLTAENANEENLITGTRYLNTKGMLPFENMVADYIKETGNHVYYAVYPVFIGSELVARGVIMEAESVEDEGEGISFNVFCYNVQPGVSIDYATGENESDGTMASSSASSSNESSKSNTSASGTQSVQVTESTTTYILNTNTGKFHLPGCRAIKQMKDKNKAEMQSTRDQMIAAGYDPCKICNP